MPSQSRLRWRTVRLPALDEIEAARVAVGGTSRGRRFATQQINQAYAVLLSSHFQGYCRDLHSEAIDHLAEHIRPSPLQDVVREELLVGRKLDTGNPSPGNIGADFGRLGLGLWPAVLAVSPRNARRRAALEQLNGWRNAIAHQDFDPVKLGSRTTFGLADVRAWRSACDGLVASLDTVVRAHLLTLVGVAPWK